MIKIVKLVLNSSGSPKTNYEDKDIKQARRRLSIMSDNKLVEGFADSVNIEDDEVILDYHSI